MGIEAGVAGKPSSLQDGNGDGSKSRGGGGSGDWRMAWASSEMDLEGGGGSVRGVPRERKESEWWRGAEREGGHAGTSAWREKEGEKGGPGAAVGSAGRPVVAPSHRAQALPLPRKLGRAVGMDDADEGTRVADARDWGEAGPSVSGGVRGRTKRREAWRWRVVDTRARAAQRRAVRFKLGLNRNQIQTRPK
jgi:hypothetical protein